MEKVCFDCGLVHDCKPPGRPCPEGCGVERIPSEMDSHLVVVHGYYPGVHRSSRVQPKAGVTCGWCGERVPDLSHVVECRRDFDRRLQERADCVATRLVALLDELS